MKFHSHLLPLKQKTLLKLNLSNHIRLYFIPYWLHSSFFKGAEKFKKMGEDNTAVMNRLISIFQEAK